MNKNQGQKPWEFHKSLSVDNLNIIAKEIRIAWSDTLKDLNTPFDSEYSRGTTGFERTRKRLLYLSAKNQYEWLSTKNHNLNYELIIGSVIFKVFRDDYVTPKKKNYFACHDFGDLFPVESGDPVTWRFTVEVDKDNKDILVRFSGYDVKNMLVTTWSDTEIEIDNPTVYGLVMPEASKTKEFELASQPEHATPQPEVAGSVGSVSVGKTG